MDEQIRRTLAVDDPLLPRIMPSNDFDPELKPRTASACRRIASILSDHAWHAVTDVVAEVCITEALAERTAWNIIGALYNHGDLRFGRAFNNRKNIRLTTRWLP